jgi:hypothetical protein
VLWRRVSLLFNMHKKDCQQNILYGITPCASMRVPIYACAPCACAQMSPRVPAQEAPHGGQAIKNIQSHLTVLGLKVGEHQF